MNYVQYFNNTSTSEVINVLRNYLLGEMRVQSLQSIDGPIQYGIVDFDISPPLVENNPWILTIKARVRFDNNNKEETDVIVKVVDKENKTKVLIEYDEISKDFVGNLLVTNSRRWNKTAHHPRESDVLQLTEEGKKEEQDTEQHPLYEILEKIPNPIHRKMVSLRYEGYNNIEIARMVERDPKTVRNQLSKFRSCYGSEIIPKV